MTEANRATEPEALAVRAPMGDGVGHPLECGLVDRTIIEPQNTSNPAHLFEPFEPQLRYLIAD